MVTQALKFMELSLDVDSLMKYFRLQGHALFLLRSARHELWEKFFSIVKGTKNCYKTNKYCQIRETMEFYLITIN